MQYEIDINGRTRHVGVARSADAFIVTIDGRTFHVDAAPIDARRLSLLVAADGSGADHFPLELDARDVSETAGESKMTGRSNVIERSGVLAPGASLAGVATYEAAPSDAATSTPSAAGGFRKTYEVAVVPDAASGQLMVRVGVTPVIVDLKGVDLKGVDGFHRSDIKRRARRDDGVHTAGAPQRIVAPMPGKVVRVLVKAGETVTARQPLIVVEAMKMENELRAGGGGTIAEVHAQEGQSVDAGALLVVIQ